MNSGPWLLPPAADLDDPDRAERTLDVAFREAVRSWPGRTAVVDRQQSLTYAELDDRAEALAAALPEGLDPWRPVGVLAGHDVRAVVAMLAVARAGGAYLVLDAKAPVAHLERVSSRHRLSAVIGDTGQSVLAERLSGGAPVVSFDAPAGRAALDRAVDPGAPVAVSSTSGTSGRPKAVVHAHRSVVHNALRVSRALEVGDGDVLAATLPFPFVAGATPVFTALLSGATALVHDLSSGVDDLVATLDERRGSVVFLTAGLLTALGSRAGSRTCDTVRWVLTGGDRLTVDQVRTAHRMFPEARLLHRYNTSETNWTAGLEIDVAVLPGTGTVPIGWPVPWLALDLVGPDGAVAVGEGEGEAEVRGDHLALGYLDDAELTDTRFSAAGAEQRYRTLDRMRRGPDGMLEFAGRADATVKIHDVLVDPVRIEAVLETVEGVEAAAVVPFDTESGERRLAAFAVADGVRAVDLRGAVAAALPAAMVPAVVEIVDELPLTPMGKVDADALATRAVAAGRPEFAPARDDLEAVILAEFGMVVGRDDLGRDDDILALGADSLGLEEAASALSARLGRDVPAATLLRHSTAARLAESLRAPARPGSSRDSRLIRLSSVDGTGVPLLLFGGGGGTRLAGIARLARHVAGRPCFLVVPRGYQYRGRIDRSVTGIAGSAVSDWLAEGTPGPVALVGMSSGGNIAVEAARQLRAAGVEVPLVVVLDSPPRSPQLRLSRSLRAAIPRHVRVGEAERARRGQRTGWARRAFWSGRVVGERVAIRARAASARWLPVGSERRDAAFQSVVAVALARYREKPFEGDLLLICAAVSDPRNLGSAPPDLRWGDFVRGSVQIRTVPSTHETLVDEPYVAETARLVREALNRVSA
ncbi:MAG: AMP-binding protein [Actinomycetales bacterium]|nr:AMP-binding protein [Actinomycetales bacterium]